VLTRLLAIGWYAGTLAVLALALPAVSLVWLVTAPFDRDRLVAGRFLRYFGAMLSLVFPLWRVRFEGKLPDGPFVLAPNHRSWLDIFVLSRLPREMKWVTKAELFRVPWVGWLFHLSADIPVRRGDPASGDDALERARGLLGRGVPVVFFPEGTRSRDGHLGRFKLGAFDTAVATGVPVVPVALTGTAEGMPRHTLWIRPASIVVRLLDAVPAAGREPAAVRDEVRARIADALGE